MAACLSLSELQLGVDLGVQLFDVSADLLEDSGSKGAVASTTI